MRTGARDAQSIFLVAERRTDIIPLGLCIEDESPTVTVEGGRGMSNLSIIYDGAILYVQWPSVASDTHATAAVYSQAYRHGHGAGKAVVEVGWG